MSTRDSRATFGSPLTPHPLAGTTSAPLPTTRAGYTAVLYVHGMGDQRRYEEVSRLVDMLERQARWRAHRTDGIASPRLTAITTCFEPPRAGSRDVGFISLRRTVGADAASAPLFRFYEAYWAPLAGGTRWRDVLGWLVGQVRAPLRGLRSDWRQRGRLRRGVLHEHWSAIVRGAPAPAPASSLTAAAEDKVALLRAHEAFDTTDARIRYPEASHAAFRESVLRGVPESRRARLGTLADRWRNAYLLSELRTLFFVVTLLGAMALGVLALLRVVALLLGAITSARVAGVFALPGVGSILQDKSASVTVLLGLAGAVGVFRFLENYMGDVQLWATYEETNAKAERRRAILDSAVTTATHVLSDPACERLVVVAHSLGTTIALDALLDLGRRNRATRADDVMGRDWVPGAPGLPLHRIEHFVTCGSPIDKVHYFFEDYQGQLRRYNETVESARGDVGTPPFGQESSTGTVQHVCWVNCWDQADVISGSIETPSHPLEPDCGVRNIELSNLTFPNPGRAHSAYFDHLGFADLVAAVVFDRAGAAAPDTPSLPAVKTERRVSTRIWQGVAIAVPWLALLAWITDFATNDRYAQLATQMAVALPLAALILAAIVAGRRACVNAIPVAPPR